MIELQPDLELTTTAAERLLAPWLGQSVHCSTVTRLKGGMVNSVFLLDFDRPPHRAVVKLHDNRTDTFATEAHALEYLRSHTSCPVPDVYVHDGAADVVPFAYLLLEHVPGVCLDHVDLEPADRAQIDRRLARVLAELHAHTGAGWGRVGDEAAGAWADVFVSRLLAVRDAAAVTGRLGAEVLARVDAAIAAAPAALQDAGLPTLVHADVWDGNLMGHHDGREWHLTALLDPDLQFADAELELAYLEVFDTPRDAFFAAYRQLRTIRPGYERRRLFYWLHTALLHVALFGDEFFQDYTARTTEQIAHLGSV